MLDERKRLLGALTGTTPDKLIIEKPIPPYEWLLLCSQTAEYVAAGMQAFEVYDPSHLPNRTPNGKVEPKSEFARIFFGIKPRLERLIPHLVTNPHSIQHPVEVRYRTPRMADGRPYATAKPHTDIWAGEPANTATIIIPLLGDVENTGLRFGEPHGFEREAFEREYANYDEGLAAIQEIRWYDLRMKPGHAYVFDSYCIHQSLSGGGGRLSLDFRVTYSEPQKTSRSEFYHPADRWASPMLDRYDSVAETLKKYKP